MWDPPAPGMVNGTFALLGGPSLLVNYARRAYQNSAPR